MKLYLIYDIFRFDDHAFHITTLQVIQRRLDGSVNFDKKWTDYKNGFGFLNTEFWLGNEKLAYLTAQKNYKLRIDFRNKQGDPYYASYDHFRVGDSGNYYNLLLGVYSGNSGNDALNFHRNMSFSTSDADHDKHTTNCAATHRGGWWFNACDTSNLNGRYGVEEDAGAVEWNGLPGGSYALKFTEMKIRPYNCHEIYVCRSYKFEFLFH
ncbi:Fibrinogen-like protein A [Apostichopus japonicus]|uniref:Fibrinogen-like protein A n=1 Tax=Stichopus japonicus TaxID=307972 RepID=A0A2G8LBY0_STIJA|nr:Fibrinogen-like protein A [Apostichopus japonicus]